MRMQSADAAQELRSANRTQRTGSAAEPRVSFCEIKGFTEQKETLGSAVLTAPDPNAASSKKKPRQTGLPQTTRQGRFYFAAISASVVSSMRFEKPHSLSYQAPTLTSVPPITCVSVAS
jgi:hypothetical protein